MPLSEPGCLYSTQGSFPGHCPTTILRRILDRAFLWTTEITLKNAAKATCSFLAALSLAFVVSASAFSQPAGVEQSASTKKLNQHQINQLIAKARTPEDHQRIAEYYLEQAQLYRNESRAYASKIEAYEKSPYSRSCLMCVSTSYSLEAAIRTLRVSKQIAEDRAARMQQLASMHEQMASVSMGAARSLGL